MTVLDHFDAIKLRRLTFDQWKCAFCRKIDIQNEVYAVVDILDPIKTIPHHLRTFCLSCWPKAKEFIDAPKTPKKIRFVEQPKGNVKPSKHLRRNKMQITISEFKSARTRLIEAGMIKGRRSMKWMNRYQMDTLKLDHPLADQDWLYLTRLFPPVHRHYPDYSIYHIT